MKSKKIKLIALFVAMVLSTDAFSVNECSTPIYLYDNRPHVDGIRQPHRAPCITYLYNGGVEKCDQRAIDKLRGYLNQNGVIVWKERPIFGDYDLFDNDCVCSYCHYYPLCYCGCPILREERIKREGKISCGHKGKFDLLEFRIQDYCWRVLNNDSLNKYNA